MSYAIAERGNILPAVAVVQTLLTRAGHATTVDGHFGPRTRDTVKDFQRNHKPLEVDGVVSVQTWPRLVAQAPGFKVLDCIDVADYKLNEDGSLKKRGSMIEVDHARAYGGDPIVIGGMCGGVAQAIAAISAAAQPGSVCLLRLHGHGSPGSAGMGAGDDEPTRQNQIRPYQAVADLFRKLRHLFSAYGSIQFMHCSTGQGPDGRRLLKMIADATGVPATAALRIQYGGGSTTFRYEGPTRTEVPGGGNLKTWAAKLPPLPEMSIP